MAQTTTLPVRPLGVGGAPLTQKRESLWQDAMRRLMRNRGAAPAAR